PDKDIYFTEQYTSSTGEFGGDLKWHLKNVIIGSMRNWSRNAMEWNLANNSSFGPHTDGGCTTCTGAITVTSGSSYEDNVGFYTMAHASFLGAAGSVRTGRNTAGHPHYVAFRSPVRSKGITGLNDRQDCGPFTIAYSGEWLTASLEAG